MDAHGWIARTVADRMQHEHEVIERACEAALTDPSGRGVRVDRYEDHVEATLSADVPFGAIHEHDHTRP